MSAPAPPGRAGPLPVAAPVRVRLLRAAPRVLARLRAPGAGGGRVHSVFDRAVNLAWADGELTVLHGPGALLAPFAAALAVLPAGLRPGDAVGGGDGGGRLEVAAGDARPVEVALHGVRPAPAALAGALGARPAPAPALASARGRAGQALVGEALAGRRLARLAEGAALLVGLGEGLTPAGDDFLVGALAAAHVLAPGWAAGWPRDDGAALDALLTLARTRTTAIGGAFLAHAVRGEASEPLRGLLAATAPAPARAAAAALARLGATSGADTLAGVAAALRALAA